ncbi:MAG: hypothetical protein QXT28_06950 [Thermofilaceae archaeon]
MRTEKEFADYLHDAINKNYLVTVLITSQTQGKIKSQNLPFGLGKTTLALWLSYFLNGRSWEKVFETLCGNPVDLLRLLEPGSERKRAAVWDAVQMTAPAESGVPKLLRRLASYLSDTRPEIACLIMTASNINAIASPLRKLVVFEVIVAERGVYEIQKITYHKNWKQPLEDLARLEYLEEGTFPKLPDDVMERYEAWRVQNKAKEYSKLREEFESRYMKFGGLVDDEGEVYVGRVVRTANMYAVQLPEQLGAKFHKKLVQLRITPVEKPEIGAYERIISRKD